MTTPNQTEREFALEVVRRLREAGHEALWAGGCVRDELLGRVPKDYDVATSALPDVVRRLFPRTIAVGAEFGVIEILGRRPAPDRPPLRIQVATFRADGDYLDGRRPTEVRFCGAEEDAKRRDFTINGMFFDPIENRLLDYVGGEEDLAAKILRAIGDPFARITEDKLRMLRAVRFAARFELTIDPATADAVRQRASEVLVCSAERIGDEMRKMLVDRHRARAMALFHELGLAHPVLPELTPGQSLAVLDRLPTEPSIPLAFAALLGNMGRTTAGEVCERLRMSNQERDRVEWLVEKRQALCEARQIRTSALKMLLGHPGIGDLLALHRADAEASGRAGDRVEFCEERLREWTASDLHPKLLLNGYDLQRTGLPPGPVYKRLLDALLEAQLDGTVTSVDQAWALIERVKGEPAS